MSKPRSRLVSLYAALAAACFLADAAQAVDLRSWDQKINDASKRFVVLASFDNAAVLDKETQLVWERSPKPIAVSWREANFSSISEPSCAAAQIGGRQGWRLPTRFELLTLADRSVTGPVKLPVNHPFVGISSESFYWTSDRYFDAADGTPRYFLVSFAVQALAFLDVNTQTSDTRIWCVRGHGSPTSL